MLPSKTCVLPSIDLSLKRVCICTVVTMAMAGAVFKSPLRTLMMVHNADIVVDRDTSRKKWWYFIHVCTRQACNLDFTKKKRKCKSLPNFVQWFFNCQWQICEVKKKRGNQLIRGKVACLTKVKCTWCLTIGLGNEAKFGAGESNFRLQETCKKCTQLCEKHYTIFSRKLDHFQSQGKWNRRWRNGPFGQKKTAGEISVTAP